MIIAHDLGTTGNKASLHSDDGKMLQHCTVPYPAHFASGGVADTLDAACDAYDMADDEDSREEVLEAAGEALADLARHLQDLDSIAQYIPTTEAEVANRWGTELKRLGSLPPNQFRTALDILLDQTRTPKESAALMALAKAAAFKNPR